ncbi:integral membrane sensor signal transduction histidine kinase [Fictibacillus macauensis ZFHKF-1]|uniref:histidine kinase n=1 Tax=Fictibacillus macauensis ZFHKF-1 TaxID=1196324 RepID=I8AJ97_9BACL|nr:HAMP domain-containing sensor histidine kinase [Fictibacillus macauensis]EIT85862.1 integral membrane sensor signal transduction histidine kinase [Fictibacillus macauensis ZFHKF-1]
MIRLNLTQRIWMSFAVLILIIGFVLAIIFPLSIKKTLTDETYNIIEEEQTKLIDPTSKKIPSTPPQSKDFIDRQNAERSVGHVILQKDFLQGDYVPAKVLSEMTNHAHKQRAPQHNYELQYKGQTLFYVTRIINVKGSDAYFISYMWDTYRDRMVDRLWTRLLWLLFFTGVIAVLPALWMARYLRAPLRLLGKKFEQIAKRNWKEPFKWEGDDEFQRLSGQFESMRRNLIRYDEAQKTFIQHASHELKTPVMTIKSYAQSVKDGIMPKNNVEDMMDVILKEADRMENRVKNMLYYTKLDTLHQQTLQWELLYFGVLSEEVISRFRFQRDDVGFGIHGDEVLFWGDREQISIAFENLIQNALRYAKSQIVLSAREEGNNTILGVWNDGEQLSEGDLENLFIPFRKGNKGQFGLGLAIVKRIAELHGGAPRVTNTEDGILFEIILPKDQMILEKKTTKR